MIQEFELGAISIIVIILSMIFVVAYSDNKIKTETVYLLLNISYMIEISIFLISLILELWVGYLIITFMIIDVVVINLMMYDIRNRWCL